MKETIILCEFCPNKGHRMLLDKTYNILSKTYDVRAFAPKCVDDHRYIKLDCDYYTNKSNIIVDNFSCIHYVAANVKAIISYADRNKIEKIVCLTYEDISMFFVSYLIPKWVKLYLMHHHNIDLLSNSSFKRVLFSTYSYKYKHIVLCNFIKKYVVDSLHVEETSVFVWPHPSYGLTIPEVVQDIDCVGISNSNDDELIGKIIDDEDAYGLLKSNNLHVVLKSHKYNYDNGFLKVFTGFLDREVYDDYIQRARSIFIAFPSDFNYRMSATIMDSLCNRKTLFGTDIPVIRNCMNRYPNLVKLYTPDTFIDCLLLLRSKKPKQEDFQEFQDNHSDVFLSRIYFSTLSGNIKDVGNYCDF